MYDLKKQNTSVEAIQKQADHNFVLSVASFAAESIEWRPWSPLQGTLREAVTQLSIPALLRNTGIHQTGANDKLWI